MDLFYWIADTSDLRIKYLQQKNFFQKQKWNLNLLREKTKIYITQKLNGTLSNKSFQFQILNLSFYHHPSTLYSFFLFVFLFTSFFRWSFFLFSFFFSPMALIMKSGVVNLSVWSNREQKKQMINFTLWWIQQQHYIFFRKNCFLKDVARLENPTTQLISLLK